MRIEVCDTVELPPAPLWALLERIEDHVEWMADAESIRFLTSSTRGTGTAFECVTRVGPIRLTDEMTVTEWEPGRAMGIVHRGIVRGTGRFRLRPEGSGTRFCWEERLRFPWWMGGALGALAAKPVLTRIWRGNLRRLRAIAERA